MKFYTFKSLAKETGRTVRTVRNWWIRHKEETGVELGNLVGNTRKFSDLEKETLLSYCKAEPVNAEILEDSVSSLAVVEPVAVAAYVPGNSLALEAGALNEAMVLENLISTFDNLNAQAEAIATQKGREGYYRSRHAYAIAANGGQHD